MFFSGVIVLCGNDGVLAATLCGGVVVWPCKCGCCGMVVVMLVAGTFL